MVTPLTVSIALIATGVLGTGITRLILKASNTSVKNIRESKNQKRQSRVLNTLDKAVKASEKGIVGIKGSMNQRKINKARLKYYRSERNLAAIKRVNLYGLSNAFYPQIASGNAKFSQGLGLLASRSSHRSLREFKLDKAQAKLNITIEKIRQAKHPRQLRKLVGSKLKGYTVAEILEMIKNNPEQVAGSILNRGKFYIQNKKLAKARDAILTSSIDTGISRDGDYSRIVAGDIEDPRNRLGSFCDEDRKAFEKAVDTFAYNTTSNKVGRMAVVFEDASSYKPLECLSNEKKAYTVGKGVLLKRVWVGAPSVDFVDDRLPILILENNPNHPEKNPAVKKIKDKVELEKYINEYIANVKSSKSSKVKEQVYDLFNGVPEFSASVASFAPTVTPTP